MRDDYTDNVLKRVASGKIEEGFAITHPNVVNSKVFINSYGNAYCIKTNKKKQTTSP